MDFHQPPSIRLAGKGPLACPPWPGAVPPIGSRDNSAGGGQGPLGRSRREEPRTQPPSPARVHQTRNAIARGGRRGGGAGRLLTDSRQLQRPEMWPPGPSPMHIPR